MNQRPWYQDGGTVLAVVVVTLMLGLSIHARHQKAQQEALPEVVPKVTGQLSRTFLGPPTLELTVWHQYAAALQNVVLVVNLNEDPALDDKQWDKREHSFESWPPNKEQAVKFTFPLKRYDPKQPIRVEYMLVGKTIKPHVSSGDWLGEGWKPPE